MKYTILINQKAVIDSGLDLDVVDLSILDFMVAFAGTPICKTKYFESRPYYFFKWVLVKDQLPILNLKTRQSVYNRMKKLMDAGVIIPHPDNQLEGESWYCFGEKYRCFTFDGPVNETLQGRKDSVTPPVNNQIHKDNTIKDNTIKDNKASPTQKNTVDVKQKKIDFILLVLDWYNTNDTIYPKRMIFDFVKYWIETSKNKKSIRYDSEKFFDMGKRLGTWFKNSSDKDIAQGWEKEEKLEPLNVLCRSLINPEDGTN